MDVQTHEQTTLPDTIHGCPNCFMGIPYGAASMDLSVRIAQLVEQSACWFAGAQFSAFKCI